MEQVTPAIETRPATRGQARARFNRAMKLVRRAHLYAGLFMTPWVFLYGISALLFNHPLAFPDQEIISFGPEAVAGTPIADAPRPAALAARVVEALNAAGGKATPPAAPGRLVRPGEAAFNRDLFAAAKGQGRNHLVRLGLVEGSGTVSTTEEPASKPATFAVKGGLKLQPPPLEPVTRGLPGLLKRLGIDAKDPTIRTSPDLAFLMERDGRTWRVSYNPQTGVTNGRAEDAGTAVSSRRFLILLHVAHGFPSVMNARWFWAVAVDLMFVSMVGWGITGLLMWWQMKNVRRVGVVVLIFSALTATALAIGMHAAVSS